MNSPLSPLTRPRATIDLDSLVANYRTVLARLGGVPAAAMVKADGYGLGAGPVSEALWGAGCRRFFVAELDEAIALRRVLPTAEINLLEGVPVGAADDLVNHNIVPILNSLDQLRCWHGVATELGQRLPAGIHVDTGMLRLGFAPDEYRQLLTEQQALEAFDIRHVMSHLASADVPGSRQPAEQLQRFREVRHALPLGTASLANSAGIFLGTDYHFDLARPGICLYGGTPVPDSGQPNPMTTVLTVEAPIIQVRSAEAGQTVGYGATHRIEGPSRIATVPVGYADGFLRASSSRGKVSIAGRAAPIVGRISMDLITIDVTGIEEHLLHPGAAVELIGPNRPIDDVAACAGSIPHELLTNLSRRFELNYTPVAADC